MHSVLVDGLMSTLEEEAALIRLHVTARSFQKLSNPSFGQSSKSQGLLKNISIPIPSCYRSRRELSRARWGQWRPGEMTEGTRTSQPRPAARAPARAASPAPERRSLCVRLALRLLYSLFRLSSRRSLLLSAARFTPENPTAVPVQGHDQSARCRSRAAPF